MNVDNEEQTTNLDAQDLMPEQEEAEDRGFNSAIDALTPGDMPTPLEDATEVKTEAEVEAEGEGESEAAADEAQQEAVKHFIGELSEEQVLDLLGRIEGLEDAVSAKVADRTFGKFGEVGQQIKALQERTFSFDPSKLNKLKELDEGIAEALGNDLAEAFSAQQFDSDAIAAQMKQDIMGDMSPYIEQRILDAMVPDVDKVVQSEDFSQWFFQDAGQEVRELFQSWDDRTRMDGAAMARAFAQYNNWTADKAKKAAAKNDKLVRSVEDGTARKAPAAKQPLTEEQAFNQRLKENR